MGLLTNREGKQRSTFLLSVFLLTLADITVFAFAYILLSEPLYVHIRFQSDIITTPVHALIISLTGTAVCCLAFILPDKRMVPGGFAGLALLFLLLVLLCLFRDPENQGYLLKLVFMYGTGPVAIGNLITWFVYRAFVRHGFRKPEQKTLEETIRKGLETKKTDIPGSGHSDTM